MIKLESELIHKIYEMTASEALGDSSLMLSIEKAGGLISYVERFVNGEKVAQIVSLEKPQSIEKELQEKIEILELGSKMDKGLISSLRNKLKARLTPAELELVEVAGSLSISNLEKEYAAPGVKYDIHKDVILSDPLIIPTESNTKIPSNIPGLKEYDEVARERASQNLHETAFEPENDNIDNKLKEKLEVRSPTRQGCEIKSFTKIQNGKLYVLVVLDECENGEIKKRKLLQDWAEVKTNIYEGFEALNEDNFHQCIMERND